MDSEDADSSYQYERRKDERHVHYADSSITSAESDNDMDKYLDEAFDNSEDDGRRESLVSSQSLLCDEVKMKINKF